MGKDLGGIAPGKLADIIVFDDLKSFKQNKIFVGGTLVVSNGQIFNPIKKQTLSTQIKKTVKLKNISKNDIAIKSKKKDVIANTIYIQT